MFSLAMSQSKPTPIAEGNLHEFHQSHRQIQFHHHHPHVRNHHERNRRDRINNVIASGNAALDRIGKLTPAEVNFTNTVRALDDLGLRFPARTIVCR